MSIIINNIRLSIDDEDSKATEIALKELNCDSSLIKSTFIYRYSVDARREKPTFVYSVGVELFEKEKEFFQKLNNKNIALKESYKPNIKLGKGGLKNPPVIVGFGPSGMFAGLILSAYGYNPIIIERGSDVDTRTKAVNEFWSKNILNVNTNVQFGEGGAGTFSDGKLTTRINDYRCDYILEQLVKFGASADIKYKAKPHIGTDILKTVVKNLREEIIKNGGKVLFDTKLTDIIIKNANVSAVEINNNEKINTNAVILAIGNSARDTYTMLMQKDLEIIAKGFSVGVRIEHLQKEIDKALYKEYAGHKRLKSAEYQLSYRQGERGVYTFCMCPGGTVVASSSEENTVVTNGMSEYARDKENANSALVVSLLPKDFDNSAVKAIEFQRELERAAFIAGGNNYFAPVQRAEDYLNKVKSKEFGEIKPSYTGKTAFFDLNNLFSSEINSMLNIGLNEFEKKLKGFSAKDAILTGVETKTSSPIRIVRDENLMATKLKGLYPCGEGAGYAGGIISSAVDGIRVAEEIMRLTIDD